MKVLPFKIWALLYPYRSNLSYLTDYDGTLIVKHIGRTEYLNEYFHCILNSLNIDANHIHVSKKTHPLIKRMSIILDLNGLKKRCI